MVMTERSIPGSDLWRIRRALWALTAQFIRHLVRDRYRGNSNKSYFCTFKFREAKMKKVLLISTLALVAVACSNSNKTEAQEEKERDSSISAQKSEDDKVVAELMRQDSLREVQENAAKDSSVK